SSSRCSLVRRLKSPRSSPLLEALCPLLSSFDDRRPSPLTFIYHSFRA
ncbi:hypothetical protein LINPERPRIM_LOCUS26334, partial [Linum perenne]